MSEGLRVLEERRWIEPRLDGTGGGYGKFKGRSVADIAKLFGQIGADANMRSVSGILRIAYEQFEVRSHLSVAIYGAWVMAPVALALGVASAVYEGRTRAILLKAFAISGLLFCGFLFGAIGTLREAKLAHTQERAIAEMTLVVLEDVVSRPGFKRGSLDSLQRQTLTRAMKTAKVRPPALLSLLD